MSGREPNIQPSEAYSHESSCLIERRGNTGVISADGQPVGWLRCNPQKAEKEGFRARRRLPISKSLARDQRRHLLLLLSCSSSSSSFL